MMRKLLLLLIPLLVIAQVDQATVKHVLAKMRTYDFTELHVYYLDADSAIVVYVRGDSADFDTIRFNHGYGDYASLDTLTINNILYFATTWADTNSFGKTKTTDTLELSGMTEGDIFQVQAIIATPGTISEDLCLFLKVDTAFIYRAVADTNKFDKYSYFWFRRP